MCREIFKTIAKRQMEGLVFHSDMTDYYNFLNLQSFKDFHEKQYMEESATFREIKNYFTNKYHQTLLLGQIHSPVTVVPYEWEDKTTFDVDKDTIKILLKESLEKYQTWENETCEIYKTAANQLFDMNYYAEYDFIMELVDNVEIEKAKISSLMADLVIVDYDFTKIKGLHHKLNR